MNNYRYRILIVSLMLFSTTVFTGWDLGNQLHKKTLEANKLYEQEQYEDALKKYTDAQLDSPESPELFFNIGNVLYQQKKYEEAVQEYQKSASSTDNIVQESQAYYNVGNCQFKMGKLDEAILSYKKALELNPEDEDAKYNLELARRLLKEMAQKQQQEQQQQEQQQQQQQQQQENQDGSGQPENEDQQQQQQEQQKQQSQEDQQNKQDEEQKQQQAGEEQGEQEEEQGENANNQDKPESMTKEEALRLLQALEESEKDDQKEQRRFSIPGTRNPQYDW